MKRGWIWVAVLLSVGVNIGVLATIGVSRTRTQARWDRPRDREVPQPAERLANHLQLEGDEKDRFLEIQQGLFRTVRRHQQELADLRSRIRRELMRDTPDPVEMDRLLDQVGTIHLSLDRAMVESVLASRGILTPEQRRRYFQVLERIQRASGWAGRPDGTRGRPDRRPPPERP